MSCSACYQGAFHESTKPTGHEEKFHGLDCYVAEPPSGSTPKAVILFLTDVFGWRFHNSRVLADEYARKGEYRVIIPDIIPGVLLSLPSQASFPNRHLPSGEAADVSVMKLADGLKTQIPWWNILGYLKKAYKPQIPSTRRSPSNTSLTYPAASSFTLLPSSSHS